MEISNTACDFLAAHLINLAPSTMGDEDAYVWATLIQQLVEAGHSIPSSMMEVAENILNGA